MTPKTTDVRRILPLSLAGLVLILIGLKVSSPVKLESADGIHREKTSSPSPEQVERRAGGDFSDPAQATNMAPGEPRFQRSDNLVVDRPNVEELVLGGRAELINSEEEFVVEVIPVEIDHEELKRAQHREISELSLDIGLPDPVVAEISRVASKSPSVFVLQGEISGIPGSEFSISVYENVAVGSFRGEGIGLRELSYAGEAGNRISLIDLTKFPGCDSCIAAVEEGDGTPEQLEDAGDEDPGLPAVEEDSAFSVIDVMIVYTREARESEGGTAAMLALCNQGIEDTNLALQNSNIDAQVYLVHTVEVEYTESDGETALDALRSTSDGVIDSVHSLRNQYGADCVSLLINYSGAGVGYLMGSESTNFASSAFNIVDPDNVGGLTFTHELGHNWGCDHAVGDGNTDPLTRGEAIFDYAHGWRWNNNANRSIMAYSPGTRVRYFSNPNVSHSGFPTGRSNLEDNARTINQTRDTVELFRSTVADMTLSDTSQAFSESGGVHSFEVVTNAAWNWSKPGSAGWIVSTESVDQNGTRTFSYSVNANTSPTARSAAISISNGTETRTHEVSQDGSASADDAYEENDTLATAFDFTQEREWLSALQGLGIQSDNDWYRISVDPSGYEHIRVDCRFIDAEGDVDIELYDSSGTRLASSASTSDNEIIDYQVSAAGTYYIRVHYGNNGNTYDLWWDDLPTLTISDEAQDFGFAGGTHDFDVVTKSSWSWLSSSGADWVTSGESPSQTGDQSFSYSVADNPLTSTRTAEITLTNGTYTRVHTITQGGRPALADLVHADPASAPTSLVAGAGFSFSSNVRNDGTIAAGAFRINCYLSVDTSFSASDIFLGSVSIPGADVDQTVPYSVTLNVPVATPEGSYYLGWIIDAGGAVTESNENNSIYFTGVRTVAGAALVPDISVPAELGLPESPSEWIGEVLVETLVIPVDNLGRAQLDIASINITGPNKANFVVTIFPAKIAALSSDSIEIAFDSSGLSTGAISATLQILSNDPDTPTAEILLSGGIAESFYPISSVTSATEQVGSDYLPATNLIQGPGTGFDHLWPHDAPGFVQGAVWVTDAPNGGSGDYFDPVPAVRPNMVFDLGRDVGLGEISFWGYADTNANGANLFRLRFATSADGPDGFGTSISYSPEFAPIQDQTQRQSFEFDQGVFARYVEWVPLDNFFGINPPGGDRVGAGEIAFAVRAGAGESLAISPTTRSIGAGGGNGTFSVSSNTTWSWSDNAAWLTSNESTSQSGNQTFSYSVAPNPSTQERTAIITITAATVTRTHTVTQAGAGESLAVSPTTRSIGAGGGNGTFSVSSNTTWSWNDNAAWLTSNESISQSGNQTFSYSVAPNTSTQERTATITITAGTVTRTHTVTQSGAAESLAISPTTRSIGAGGGNGTFSVSSNTTWSWSDNATWLTSNESTSQSGNQTFSYSVAPNTSTQERTATITITAGTVTRTHTVTQAGAGESLAISPTTRSIGPGGGNGTFSVSSNTTWSWSDNAAWLTSNESTSQSGNQTFSYSVAPNTSTQERTATITITAGTVTRTHTVTQSGAAESLAISPTTRSIGAGGGNGTFSVSSNTTWSWSDNATWLTSNESTSQSGNQTFSYSVAPNTSTQERTATITITAGTVTRTHTVTQVVPTNVLVNTTPVAANANVSYFIPNNGALGDTWQQPGFDDSSWKNVPHPVGFESEGGTLEPLIATNISADMKTVNAGGYFRFPFQVNASRSRILSATLNVTIDDGYVAYLNGVEVARFNAPTPINWNSPATGSRGDSTVLSTKLTTDISSHLNAIVDGENILAIQAMNASSGGSDFLLGVELTAVERKPESLDPAETTVDALGGELSFAVNVGDGVAWTAESVADWLTITGGASGTGSATYQYFRFTTTQTAGDTMIQVSEFDLINDGNKVDYTNLTVTNPGGNSPGNEEPPKVIDGDINTKWLDFNIAPLVFTFNGPVTIDSYNFATANDALGRTPISWTFEGSSDGATWVEIDSRNSVTPPGSFFTFFDNAFDFADLPTDGANGAGVGTVTYTVEPNPSTEERSATISITAGTVTLTHTVTQEGDTDTPIFDLNVSTSRLASGAIERVTVSFPTSITAVYSIEGSADMRTWVTLEAGINGNDNIIERSFPVIDAMRHHGFYRIRRE